MTQDLWTAVDAYYSDLYVASDPVLETVLEASHAAGLPAHYVAPNQGKLLMLLAQIHKAKRILEIGTLGGYSTIWLARALPSNGQLITLEADPKHASVARQNIAQSRLAHLIELRVGQAGDSLQQIIAEDQPPFDFIFIDADKPSNPQYLEWSLRLSCSGTIIIADNVVREGAVIETDNADPRVRGIRQFNEMAAADPRVDATALQTVGSKGYDGFALLWVK